MKGIKPETTRGILRFSFESQVVYEKKLELKEGKVVSTSSVRNSTNRSGTLSPKTAAITRGQFRRLGASCGGLEPFTSIPWTKRCRSDLQKRSKK